MEGNGPCPVYDAVNAILLPAMGNAFGVTLQPYTDHFYPGERYMNDIRFPAPTGPVTSVGGLYRLSKGSMDLAPVRISEILEQVIGELGGEVAGGKIPSGVKFFTLPIGDSMQAREVIKWVVPNQGMFNSRRGEPTSIQISLEIQYLPPR